jgi:HEAT repeat protein
MAALTGGSSEERWAAARAVRELPGAAESLGQALRNEDDQRVREAIFTSLARLRTTASVQAVLPHLLSDDANLRAGALDALRAMPEATAPHLPSLLRDADPDVRLLACDLARGVPTTEANRLLCDLLYTEREPNVCAAAVDVLAEIGGAAALPVMARCAERFPDDPFLSFSIRIAAERIGLESSEPHG